MFNLEAIKPGSSGLMNFFRCYRVFWNFAWTISDNARFKELGVIPDWEFVGLRHFEAMQSSGGAVLLTAHMGSYDVGARLLSETSENRVIVVRAPEVDPQTRAFEESHTAEGLRIEFNVKATDLALDLLHALRDGSIVAIQGDRITPGISDLPATLFGKPTRVPAGPFALALAAQVPLHPVFVMRRGRRRYRVLSCPPIEINRTLDREQALAEAVASWMRDLEGAIRDGWYQWFMFEPFSGELAA